MPRDYLVDVVVVEVAKLVAHQLHAVLVQVQRQAPPVRQSDLHRRQLHTKDLDVFGIRLGDGQNPLPRRAHLFLVKEQGWAEQKVNTK